MATQRKRTRHKPFGKRIDVARVVSVGQDHYPVLAEFNF
jgi:hypothetical protein